MFDNIGRKIMTLAQITTVLGIVASILWAINLWIQPGRLSSYYESAAKGALNSTAWAILIGGCVGSWIGSFVMYGFGQLIEDTSIIAANSLRPAVVVETKKENAGIPTPKADDFSEMANSKGLSDIVAAAELDRACSVGKTVTFGSYEQDNNKGNGQEAIQWRVLARKGSKALLISVYNLDNQPYNTQDKDVTWETCTLRGWLNSTFLNAAFTKEQQKAIVETRLMNTVSGLFRKKEGNSTQNGVFLLSEAEAEQHFTGDADRIAKNTVYAKARGAYTNDNGAGWWWLRSPGINTDRAAVVIDVGSVYLIGGLVNRGSHAVRPALWLDLSSL